jgi:HK97 gp10 family phage protein
VSLQVKFEGAADLEAALKELVKTATQKNVVRRALTQAAEPMRGLASALAPYDENDPAPHLREVIEVSSKTASHQNNPFAMPGDVTVYVGPTRTAGHQHDIEMEFGSFKDRPQPFMRPAWEATHDRAQTDLGFYMWLQIDSAALRAAAKTARLAAR